MSTILESKFKSIDDKLGRSLPVEKCSLIFRMHQIIRGNVVVAICSRFEIVIDNITDGAMSILPTTFPPNNVSPRPLFHLDQTAPFAHLPCESGENKIGLSVMETLYLERVALMVVLWSACSPITLMIRVQSRYFLLRNCLKRGHSWTLHWGN